VLLAAAAATVALDLATKQLVTTRLAEGRLYALAPGWGLRRVHNPRGSLGGLSTRASALALIAVVAGVALALPALPSPGAATPIGLGIAIGGAAGNVGDRLVRGEVVDFVAAGRWPVFNVADAAMVLGLLLAAGSLV
jgi:signal peptidase II